MKGFKFFTHDLRSPLQGGEPVWDGKTPFELPKTKLDISGSDCGEGWNFVEDIQTGLPIVGLWPNGRPSRIFEVAALGAVVKRSNKIRTDRLMVLKETSDSKINKAIGIFSKKHFGTFAKEMTKEQIKWRLALSRPMLHEEKVEENLREVLDVRGLKDWKLKKDEAARDARDARDARAAWDAWAARAAWDARAAWAAWDAWDAWDALLVFYTSKNKWIKYEPDYLTRGIREAYMNGLEIAIPTGPKELGWVCKK